MNVLIMIDSFKNTLKSTTLNRICKSNFQSLNIKCDCIPIADGGENSLDSLAYNHKDLKRHYLNSVNAFFKPIKTYYLIDKKNKIAYIEIAKIVGFKVNKIKDIYNASSYGIGLIILDAYKNYKVKKVYLCLGGSISNDVGCGMLEALGVEFYNLNKQLIKNVSLKDLSSIESINLNNMPTFLKKIKFYILSDVINPLTGKNGATYYYGLQKGLSEDRIEDVDRIINKIATLINPLTINNKGAGAAGGIGYAAISVLNAKYKSGINFILNHHNFKNIVSKYDLVITGEGQVDKQSFKGKVISGILKRHNNVCILCAKSLIKRNNIYQIADYFSLKYSLKHPSFCFDEFCKIVVKKISSQ